MFNKIINYVKENYKFLIAFVIVLFLGLFHLPYNIYVGGGTISLDKRIEIENEYHEKGSFNLSYVTSVRSTIPTYLLSYIFDWDKENINDIKIDENDNTHDMWEREKIYLQEANDNAIINAYRLAGEDININKEVLKVLYIDPLSDTDLKIGDTLIKVNGIEISEFNDLVEIVNHFDIGSKIDVLYKRGNKEYNGYFKVQNINGEKKAGLYLVKLYDYSLNRAVKLNFNNREGGPSGGFMLSLAIYNRLIKEDLTKSRKIVGTGTIDYDGNIGEIGGIKYKLKGAVSGKADVFFVPSGNYQEAMKIKKEKGYDINIVEVKTLSDAIRYLMK